MKDTTKENILNNYINGNFSDFKKAVKKMSKMDLLDFIEFCNQYGTQRHIIINQLRLALSYK